MGSCLRELFLTLGRLLLLPGVEPDPTDFADDDFGTVKQNHAGRQQVAFGINQRDRTSRLIEMGDDRVCGSQVDSDCGLVLAHPFPRW